MRVMPDQLRARRLWPLTPTAAIPIYGRSADNLRDHRHVTSLLQRTICHRHGVLVRPTLSFDERGHTLNQVTYAVLGAEADGTAPAGFFADVEYFIGEGGTLDWPEAVVANQTATQVAGAAIDGYESIGGLRFRDVELLARARRNRTSLILAILHDEDRTRMTLLERLRHRPQLRARNWKRHEPFWREKVSTLRLRNGRCTASTAGCNG